MGRVSDFGGHANERGRGCAANLTKANAYSYRCNSCGHVSYYTKTQVGRMKHQPHCVACGGTTEETDSSFERRTGVKKKHVGKMLGRCVTEYCPGRFRENLNVEFSKQLVCRFCFKRFRSTTGLKLHYEDSHGFVDEF